jgi:hypothetical protein
MYLCPIHALFLPDPVTAAIKPAYFVLQTVNLPIPWFVLLQVKCRHCKISLAFLKFILGELISKPPTQREESEIRGLSGKFPNISLKKFPVLP